MHLKPLLISICFSLLCGQLLHAQHEDDNWYFGKYAALNFSTSPPTVLNNNAMYTGIAAATVSDKKTGKLLFYTDGSVFWNQNHKEMPGSFPGGDLSKFSDVNIIPFAHNPNKYHIFSRHWIDHILYEYEVDMLLDGGLGGVTKLQVPTSVLGSNVFLTIKHDFDTAYWIVSYYPASDSDFFFAYRLTDSGLQKNPVISAHKSNPNLMRVGEITATSDGSKIAVTYYDLSGAAVQVYDFDKQCGTVGFPTRLSVDLTWTQALGVSFSPDDTKLYVTVSPSPSYLVQYYGPNFSQRQIVATSPYNFHGVRLGPDKQLYISLNDSLNHEPSERVDVLLHPNELGAKTSYVANYLDLGTKKTSNYRFPSLIYDKSPWGNRLQEAITADNVCLGDTTVLSLTNNIQYDSILWDLGENNLTDTQKTPRHVYAIEGFYKVSVDIARCHQHWKASKTIGVYVQPQFNWPADTTFCFGDTFTLNTPFASGQFVWNTGNTTPAIKISKPGTYWAKVVLGSCSTADTIRVNKLPPVLVDIGDDYTICDEDNELVLLDAGKGYAHYKWTPTDDTTQWIVVEKAGNYYVVVEDYRGCKGNDGTQIAHLCNFTFYMPNVFTPNGDGKNEVFAPTYTDIESFTMQIYNRWGEKMFETNNPALGWDGEYKNHPAPAGIYIWQLSFKGIHNKRLSNFNHKGMVTLLR